MGACAGGCFGGLAGGDPRPRQASQDREKFEQTTRFLASVPLFKKQLPRAELPLVAQQLKETTWPQGKALCKQGETGQTFFLIYSGSASVIVTDERGEEYLQATLNAGDWLGGHTLTSERPNVATVVANGGSCPLVTLSMSKATFERSGLRSRLRFPKRPALSEKPESERQVVQALGCQSQRPSVNSLYRSGELATCTLLPESERDFVLRALGGNANLRALYDCVARSFDDADEVMQAIANSAERREVPAGQVVARRGELGQEFFMIREGAFEVRVGDHSEHQRSAEEALASTSNAERLRRKQHFLLQLYRSAANPADGKGSQSMIVDTRDRQSMMVDKRERLLVHTNSESSPPLSSSTGDLLQQSTAEPEDSDVVMRLGIGDSFGELSLIYNTRREATFKACENAVVYVISRREFKRLFSRHSGRRRFEEDCALLDEVDALTPLLQSQRRELASNAGMRVKFGPGERIIHQGKPREAAQWYVIHRGTAVLSHDAEVAPGGQVQTRVLAELGRASHFGERSLLRQKLSGVCVADNNVDAGPEGLTCLTFDGEIILPLLSGLNSVEGQDQILPSVEIDVEEFCKAKQLRSFRCPNSIEPEKLRKICLLGKGAFGDVFLVRDAASDKLFAMKRLSKGHIMKEGMCENLCWERDLLMMMDSAFVVHLHRTFQDAQHVYLLLEAALGGDLLHLMVENPQIFRLDKPRGSATAFYVACLIAGLEHLHERKIVYRDLKPENVMLSVKGYAVITDMGLARFVVGKANTQAGTPDYMAPEVIDSPHFHDNSADWWSLGAVAFELLCKQPPFDDEGLDDQVERLLAIRRSQEAQLNFSFDCPVLAKMFVTELLQKLPRRLGADGGARALRQHQFFSRLPLDFDALHHQTLPSPMELPWSNPEGLVECGVFDLPRGDSSLFVEYVNDNTGWEKDF
mmetsp:Transcript_35946/g.110574  ORF Transcript_35946/g.110574 Transcript_35946/m.110574 type:complete len:925 (-) Transcript_35946:196-2970(-)